MIKALFVVVGILITCSLSSTAVAKTRVAVSKFDNKAGSGRCYLGFFGSNLGSGFTDQIITSLVNTGKYEIVERDNLKKMYNEEHKLVNADHSTLPQGNKFKAAHYSITGAVTSFELCNSKVGGNVDVGGLLGMKNSGLKVGGSKASAKVVIDLRVVDVESGTVVTSLRSEGSSSAADIDLKGNVKGAGFGTNAFYSSPIGEATREAIDDAVKKLVTSLPEKSDGNNVAENSQVRAVDQRKPSAQNMNSTSGSSGVEPSETTSNLICPASSIYMDSSYGYCKVIQMSKTGQRAQTILMANGKETLLDTTKILEINPIQTSPQIGQLVFMACKSIQSPMSCPQKLITSCKVIDSVADKVAVVCNRREYTVSQDYLFSGKPFSSKRVPASK